MEYNAAIVWEASDADDDELVEALAGYCPAVSRTLTGHVEAVITLEADSLSGAIATASLVGGEALDAEMIALSVMTTAEFDARLGIEHIPEQVSVTQAAEMMGITRTSVQQRIDAGTLPARKIGRTFVIPRAAVEATRRARTKPTGA